jgi:hypothetical protein
MGGGYQLIFSFGAARACNYQWFFTGFNPGMKWLYV